MLSLRLLTGVAFCAVLACACSAPNLSTAAVTSQSGTGGKVETGAAANFGGSKNHTSPSGDKPEIGGSNSTEEEAGAAGASAGEAGAFGAPTTPPPSSCELDHTCNATCEQTKVTCGIDLIEYACEYNGFEGATVDVSCGERAVVGTACCGGCGCIPVEVYFDGTYCWQGVPQCELDQFHDKVIHPHAPTTPNPDFVPPINVPGTFYLGNGGIGGTGGSPSSETGGSDATGGTGGRAGADSGGESGESSESAISLP